MKKTAVILLDYINDIVHPEGKIAGGAQFIKDNQVIEKVNQVVSFARQNNLPIIFVKVGFNQGYPECPENSPLFGRAKQMQALQLNTWGTEVHEDIAIQPQDLIIIKHRVSAFYATPLEAFLRANKIEQLIIAGVSTDMAVQSTSREAHDRDYLVTIVADACGAANCENHDNTLKLLARIATIVDTTKLNEVLN